MFIGHGLVRCSVRTYEETSVFGFVSSRFFFSGIMPAAYVALSTGVRPVVRRFSGRWPRIDPCEGPTTWWSPTPIMSAAFFAKNASDLVRSMPFFVRRP